MSKKQEYITIEMDNMADIDVDDYNTSNEKPSNDTSPSNEVDEYIKDIIAKPEEPTETTKPEVETKPEEPTSTTKQEDETKPEEPVETTKPEVETKPEEPVETTKPEVETKPEEPVETTKQEVEEKPEEAVKAYDQQVYAQAMDTITTLMSGMKFTKSNWMLLLNKITTVVKGVKRIDNDTRVQLIYDLLMDYLDNHTDLSDDVIDFINKNATYTCQFMLEKTGVNKKEHKANTKKVIKQYKLYAIDTDAMINTLQITNLLVNKITVMIRAGDFDDINNLQRVMPEIVMMCVKVVDKFKHLTSSEKSSLIAQAIEEVIENEVMNKLEPESSKYKTLELLIINLPMMITTVTGVINGDIDFVKDVGSVLKRGFRKVKKLFICCCKKN
jgi:hypothetical protein